MCGICGYVSDNKYDVKLIDGMTMAMRHRGPDRQDTVHMKLGEKQCAFGHCRLSIIDTTDAGNQPMWSEDGKYCIVYNGEIYNYKALKEQILEDGGALFHSDSDTEVLLKGYMRWGREVVRKIEGMFAFAIYDGTQNEIFVARDRLGKKPLYYYNEKGIFIFASEIKPLILLPGIELEENTKVLAKYLKMGYFPDPETVFQQIKKLPPGYYGVYKNASFHFAKYWDLFVEARNGNASNKLIHHYDVALEQLEEAILEAVEKRLVADVPVGVFLSGGIDSTVVAAMAQRISDGGVDTYNMGFEVSEYDEAGVARRISRHIGSRHHEHYVTDDDLNFVIECIPKYFDEPFGDTSMLPSMILSQFARGDITVALSGDGGDELFGGYPQYLKEHAGQYFDGVGQVLSYLPASLIGRFPRSVRRVVDNRDRRAKTQFVLHEEKLLYKSLLADESDDPMFFIEEEMDIRDWQFRRMVLDMKTTLPGDMLHKVDRASMSASLEVRSPLLDEKVVDVSFRIPQRFKIRNGIGKRILRDIAYKYVPREIIDLPKKGFCVPYEEWMRTSLKEKILDYTEEGFLARQGIFHPETCKMIISEFINGDNGKANVCWNILMYQMWWECYKRKHAKITKIYN